MTYGCSIHSVKRLALPKLYITNGCLPIVLSQRDLPSLSESGEFSQLRILTCKPSRIKLTGIAIQQ